ncbi:chemotaxis protein CheW [Novosphingobium sp. RD2P27]|uniref:Chemotaxis protein CheW n=1 Tax=Novosphingobium kalidii TaxID=3230299 RepID=A0ABV2D2Y5_9SPHN
MNAPAALEGSATQSREVPPRIDVGLMRLCGRDLAVPAASVREVVPLPNRLHPAFSESGSCAGTIVVRGRAIPVLDIAERLGLPPREEGGGVVLILRHDQALIGLIMDMVSGLARITEGQIQPLHAVNQARAPIVASSFTHDDTLVGLIDPAAVFAVPGIATAQETSLDKDKGASGQRSSVVLVTLADANIALDSGLVVATVPGVQLKPSVAPASKWIGVVQYLEREVPVVDDLSLFGLSGRAAEGSGGAVVLLKFDDQHILGLKIDSVRRILALHENAIQPLPPALREQLTLFAGAVIDREGQQNLMLDHQALHGCEALRMICALNRSTAQIKSESTLATGTMAQADAIQPFVVFRTGKGYRAAPLASVKQIIPYPSTVTGIRRAGSALQGIASYNGSPLPLLDLESGSLDHASGHTTRMVLVVEQEGAYNGLVVEKLETIARATAQRRPGGSAADCFIQTRVDNKARAVKVCDLTEEVLRSSIDPPSW